jgi:hypothetical protein
MDSTTKLVLSSIFAVVFGATTSYVLSLTPSESFIVGLLGFLLLEHVFLTFELNALTRVHIALRPFLSMWGSRNEFDIFFNILLLKSISNTNRVVSYDQIEILDVLEISSIWHQCISFVSSSMLVSSYIASDYWWKKGYSSRVLDLQKIKSSQGIHISRIFIYDDPAEMQSSEIMQTLRYHSSSNIDAKTASRLSLESDRRISTCKNMLGTWDMALIDNTYAVLHYLTGDRDSKRLIVSRNHNTVERLKTYFNYVLQQVD